MFEALEPLRSIHARMCVAVLICLKSTHQSNQLLVCGSKLCTARDPSIGQGKRIQRSFRTLEGASLLPYSTHTIASFSQSVTFD